MKLYKSYIKTNLLHLSNVIFDSSNKIFFKKQRIIALINLVKDIRENINNKMIVCLLNLNYCGKSKAYKKIKNCENYV